MRSKSTNVMASNTDPLSSENGTSGKGILMMEKKSPEVRGGDALPDNDKKKDSNKLISQLDLPRLELERCYGPSYRLVSESAPRTKLSRAVLNDKLVSKASGSIFGTDQDRWKKNQEKMLLTEAQRSELDVRIERLAAAIQTVAELVNHLPEPNFYEKRGDLLRANLVPSPVKAFDKVLVRLKQKYEESCAYRTQMNNVKARYTPTMYHRSGHRRSLSV